MRATITRNVLQRIFGFAEPTVTGAGELTYECLYCGASADDRRPSHAFDCPYWLALPSFASPGATRLVDQVLGG